MRRNIGQGSRLTEHAGRLPRVALVLPASNTVMEPDLVRELRGRATLHTARMLLSEPISVETEQRMLRDELPHAVRCALDVRPDALVLGCSSAGSAYEGSVPGLAASVMQDGIPTIDAMEAIARQIRLRTLDRISVLTPYAPDVNATVGRTLGRIADLDHVAGMNITSNAVTATVPLAVIKERARLALHPRSAGLVVMCTNLRAAEIRHELEEMLAVPVVTANSAVAETLKSLVDEADDEVPRNH